MLKLHLPPARWLVFFSVIVGVSLILDLQTKAQIAGTQSAVERKQHLPQRYDVIPHYFSLLYDHELNRGTLFSMGNAWGDASNYFLMGMCLLAVIGILGWVLFWPGNKRCGFLALVLGLILGGALGNFYDRLIYGGVRDWIWIYYERGPNDFPFNWPVFNLADSFLVCGVLLFAMENLFASRKPPQPAPSA
jgi:lipoprotein signal peptidase